MKRTSLGAAAMPLVLTTGKNLYLAIITLYMLEMAPPAETKVALRYDNPENAAVMTPSYRWGGGSGDMIRGSHPEKKYHRPLHQANQRSLSSFSASVVP